MPLILLLLVGVPHVWGPPAMAATKVPALRMPPVAQGGNAKECLLTPDSVPLSAKIRPLDDAQGKLILGGGGWNPEFYRKPFVDEVIRSFEAKKEVPDDDVVSVILSAAKNSEMASGGYLNWARKQFQGKVPVVPIYTTAKDHKQVVIGNKSPSSVPGKETRYTETRVSKTKSTLLTEEFAAPASSDAIAPPSHTVSTDPNSEANLQAIRRAKTAIIIDGGMVGSLAHIAGTKLAEELRKAYLRGVTIWASSEGTNAVGTVNASLLWPKNVPGLPVGTPATTESRTPSYVAGIGIAPFGVSSHVDGPRLIAKYAGCGSSATTGPKTENEITRTLETFEATNPYAFLDPIRQVATAENTPANYPIFGIPDEARMTYEKKIAHFESADPFAKFFIFDPRYPVSDKCDYFYVTAGARYDVETGKVLAAPTVPPVDVHGEHGSPAKHE